MECRVNEVKPLGTGGGAGNLVIAEVLVMHIADSVLDEQGMIDQRKLDLVARLGGHWYTRANASTIFEVEKPNLQLGIGVDALPATIRNSKILTGNNLGQLGNVHAMPDVDPSLTMTNSARSSSIIPSTRMKWKKNCTICQRIAGCGPCFEAWQILLAVNQ